MHMTDFRKLIFGLTCLAGMMTAIASCEKNGPEGGGDGNEGGNDQKPSIEEVTGPVTFLSNEENATATVTLEMASDWTASSNSSWLDVTPASGAAGTVELTVTATEVNYDAKERVGTFIVASDSVSVKCSVVQDVYPSMTLADTDLTVGGGGEELTISFWSNVDFEIKSEADWITIVDLEEDSVLIVQEEKIYSRTKEYTLLLDVASNDGEMREGRVVVNAPGITDSEIVITQLKVGDADFSRSFFRRSFIAKFSATWCGPCYTANEYIHEAMNNVPDRMEIGAYMLSSNGGGLSEWSGADKAYNELYYAGIAGGGIPFVLWNNYAVLEGAYPPDTYVALNDEALTSLPAHTGIAGRVIESDGTLDVFLDIASTETAEYSIRVYLLEDGLLYSGCAAGSTYPNNDVIREELTEAGGEPVSLTANEVTSVSYSCPVPSYVKDAGNLHVLAVLYRSGEFTSSVIYSSGLDKVVDNVVDIPVNSEVDFEYEN